MKSKFYWPDNAFYISFSIMLCAGTFNLIYMSGSSALYPYPYFLTFGLWTFYFINNIKVDDKYLVGPSAYGKLRRTKIPVNEVEAFYTKRPFGFSYLVMRHKYSSRQIFMRTIFFSKKTMEELKSIFPEKKKES